MATTTHQRNAAAGACAKKCDAKSQNGRLSAKNKSFCTIQAEAFVIQYLMGTNFLLKLN